MLRLKTFGGLSLKDDRGAVVEHVQRRRMALIALLAAAGEPGMSRDKLLLYLWSESDEEHGRALLRQALHALRRDLNAPELFLGTSELRLNPQVVSSDVCDFEDLLRAGELERAVGLYSGPFLDGVHLGDAPEFERWAEEKRTDLARRTCRAYEMLATAAAGQGNHATAAAWWGRVAAMDPLNSRITVALMREMTAAGNPAGALQQARVHEALVREELGTAPHPDVLEAAERIRQAPFRSSGPVPVIPSPPPPPSAPAAPPDAAAQAPRAPPRRSNRRLLQAGVATLVGIALLWVLTRAGRRQPVTESGANTLVVAPFRADVSDSGLTYLREGMMDLLAARFTGEAGPRAISPRTVMLEWATASTLAGGLSEPAALDLAARLGARHMVLGSVVGTMDRLTVTGSLLQVTDGELLVQASVSGPEDSLSVLVDQLAAQLLVGAAGETSTPASLNGALAGTPLPALRAYLEGQAAYRRARYAHAVERFERALEIDSTFALAALRLAMTGYWLRGAAWTDRLDLAWKHRGRLSPRDRALLDAIAGPNYPATAWWSEDLGAAERAVAAAPDRPEAWFLLGDVLYHLGPGLGRPQAWRDAESAFRRALGLDSSFAAPREHLLELAAAAGDSGEVRRLARALVGAGSASELADFLRWRAAVALGDSAERRRLRAGFDRTSVPSLLRIVGTGQLEGIASIDVDAAAAALRRRPTPLRERWVIGRSLHYLALNRGRVTAAAREVPPPAEGEPVPRWAERLTVLDALFGDGDSAAARRAAARLAASIGTQPSGAGLERAAHTADRCVLGLWDLLRGDFDDTPGTIATLRAPPSSPDSLGAARSDSLCATVLEAWHARALGLPEAAVALRALDSTMRLGPAVTNDVEAFANLVVARLHEVRGDLATALAAVRRRPHQWAYGPIYLSTFLHDEYRLALRSGDTAGALRAGRHYLALRTSPDAGVADRVERLKAWMETRGDPAARRPRGETSRRGL